MYEGLEPSTLVLGGLRAPIAPAHQWPKKRLLVPMEPTHTGSLSMAAVEKAMAELGVWERRVSTQLKHKSRKLLKEL